MWEDSRLQSASALDGLWVLYSLDYFKDFTINSVPWSLINAWYHTAFFWAVANTSKEYLASLKQISSDQPGPS